MISFVVVAILSCGTHVAVQWGSLADKNRYCGMDLDIDTALVISDAATNLMIWVMPMPMVWRMRLSWRRKLAVVGILMIGSMYVASQVHAQADAC
jgi:hypothetical protein